MGRLIVIEGLDGSGKATQAGLLAGRLAAAGHPVRQVSFPNYESRSSALVQMYLAGEFGENPGDVNAYAASAFYAVDRYAGYKTDWGAFYRQGGLLLADRYTTSNAVHQCSKLPQEQWAGYLAWLDDFEYAKMGIPKPDLVLFLDVDTALSQQLLAARYAGRPQKDIHEQDLDYLNRSRTAAHWCAQKLGWQQVACCRAGQMRDVNDIADELEAAVLRAGVLGEAP